VWASSWIDGSGNLWLYGGLTPTAGLCTSNCVLGDMWEYTPSSGKWTLISGSDQSANLTELYGSSGVFDSSYTPGSRDSAVNWVDSSGNFWLFGGVGMTSNELWEFNPSTKKWAWISGSTIPAGASGVYGSQGKADSGNIPGGRERAAGWADSSGNFWLFGGYGVDSTGVWGALNDLWKFNPSLGTNGEWTWIGGSNTLPGYNEAQPGVYGSLNTPAGTNIPGGREYASSWSDPSGNLWLFGGEAYDGGSGPITYFNDLWKYNPTTNVWTWMSGSNAASYQYGVYGTLGQSAAANTPGSRYDASSWTDKNGNLWLFGGNGGLNNAPDYWLNDLWVFEPSTNLWAWMGGSNGTGSNQAKSNTGSYEGEYGVYGTQNAPAASNNPGSREAGSTWIDKNGNFWLYGGSGYDTASVGFIALDDLWVYLPSVTPSFPTAATPVISFIAGSSSASETATITDTTPGDAIYYTTDGVTTPTSSSTLYTGAITVTSGETIKAIAAAQNYLNSSVASAAYTSTPPDFSLAASPSSATVTTGQNGVTTITVTPLYGFNSTITFSAVGAAGSFSPATVTPPGTTSTTLTIPTSTLKAALHRSSFPWLPGSSLAAAFCCLGWKKRRRLQMLLLLTVSVAGLTLITSCSGSTSGGSTSVQPQTIIETITATSGTISHSATFTLTVN